MTEDEANTLACEFEHNKTWRVTQIFESNIMPGFWCVSLAHRREQSWACLSRADLTHIKSVLRGDGVIKLAAIDLH